MLKKLFKLLSTPFQFHDSLSLELCKAAKSGSMDELLELLEAGARAKFNDSEPLIIASANRHVDCVRVLLEYGGDPNGQDGSALTVAVVNDDLETVSLLLSTGMDIERTSAVYCATVGGHIEPLKQMMSSGATVPVRYSSYAEDAGYPKIAALIRNSVSDIGGGNELLLP